MAHWVFKVQYLKTSLVLPMIFIEAKLEYEIDASLEYGSIDTNRLEETILKYENDDAGHDSHEMSRNVKRIFNRFDAVIDRQKQSVSRINCYLLVLSVTFAVVAEAAVYYI